MFELHPAGLQNTAPLREELLAGHTDEVVIALGFTPEDVEHFRVPGAK